MEIKKYRTLIEQTAVFPQKVENFGLAYGWLGLIDEISEVGSAILVYEQSRSYENKKLLLKEFGDVIWYMTALCEEIGIDVATIINYKGDLESLKQYGTIASFCGKIKKFYRDQKKIDPQEMTGVLAFSYAAHIKPNMDKYDITIEEVMETNYNKLIKRKEENKLKGDGDNR